MIPLLFVMLLGQTRSFLLNHPLSGVSNDASSSALFLEDWVAEMIDGELHRQAHKKDYEKEWMEKNRAAVFHRMETDFVNTQDPEAKDFQMYKKGCQARVERSTTILR